MIYSYLLLQELLQQYGQNYKFALNGDIRLDWTPLLTWMEHFVRCCNHFRCHTDQQRFVI